MCLFGCLEIIQQTAPLHCSILNVSSQTGLLIFCLHFMHVNASVCLTLSLENVEKLTEDSAYNELPPAPLSLVMEEQINSTFIRACLSLRRGALADQFKHRFILSQWTDWFFTESIIYYLRSRESGRKGGEKREDLSRSSSRKQSKFLYCIRFASTL